MKHRSGFGKQLSLLRDLPSRAKCDGCEPHLPCPKHNAPGYATWRARHKVYL